MNIPWYKKCLGYLFPIILTKLRNDKHSDLKVKYYQGQIQLESDNALYSDGYRYSPFRIGYNYIDKKNELQGIQNFLLLGAGLGSALHRLQKIYNIHPDTSLIEYDQDISLLSQKYLLKNQKSNVHFIVEDALDYLLRCNQQFDLVGIDLFDNLENSFLILQNNFWSAIKKVTRSNSNIILNTIFLEKREKQHFENRLSKEFTFERMNRKPNYIYILKHKKWTTQSYKN